MKRTGSGALYWILHLPRRRGAGRIASPLLGCIVNIVKLASDVELYRVDVELSRFDALLELDGPSCAAAAASCLHSFFLIRFV